MKNKFVYLTAFSAAVLVLTAAYFSITGFAKLFSGAVISIIVLMCGFELAKVIAVSFLYRYWQKTAKLMKVYLLIAVGLLMLITSAGIYGFLSAAYLATSEDLAKVERAVELLESKKFALIDQVNAAKLIVDGKNKRSESLMLLRVIQENRLDSLYNRGWFASAKRTENLIKDADIELKSLAESQVNVNKSIQAINDSIYAVNEGIIELQGNTVKGDIGPLKYIAALTNKSIDSVVNFFILLLVFISDPLAVCLVIITNKVLFESNYNLKKNSL